jgi:DNA helicase-2/ATP-dependent DNA helicase PcrA
VERQIKVEPKQAKFETIGLIVCKKAKGISPEECYSSHGRFSTVCQNLGKCRIWEKSDEQLNYVLHNFDTNSFLKACAGSGKTETVGLKAAYEMALWKEINSGIAVLTFTNNAAAIINERVAHIIGGAGLDYPHFIGTFDSWLHRYVANPFLHLITGYQGLQNDHSVRLVEDRYDADFLNAFMTKYQYRPTGLLCRSNKQRYYIFVIECTL